MLYGGQGAKGVQERSGRPGRITGGEEGVFYLEGTMCRVGSGLENREEGRKASTGEGISEAILGGVL